MSATRSATHGAPEHRRHGLALLAVAVLASTFACARAPVAYTSLDGDLDELRAAFNRGTGSVRAVLLTSPT